MSAPVPATMDVKTTENEILKEETKNSLKVVVVIMALL